MNTLAAAQLSDRLRHLDAMLLHMAEFCRQHRQQWVEPGEEFAANVERLKAKANGVIEKGKA